jgi:hypothetical protein
MCLLIYVLSPDATIQLGEVQSNRTERNLLYILRDALLDSVLLVISIFILPFSSRMRPDSHRQVHLSQVLTKQCAFQAVYHDSYEKSGVAIQTDSPA